ncbi:DUF928 domain-containing protein [Dolichospermum sp. LEGE 00246]|uniref:DUF928 domain-containing protein n=1 Tax=Dolichospermum sp. LEGE 00246 TaxID=1828605 RepID=UPI00188024E2|nr:DUF928 domain-containing protein [Dolichospermum sp. LEGE 00246]MBE9255938.1 DUF928 domain-containing protein [Dolichospermum sp. LEGE 00246]
MTYKHFASWQNQRRLTSLVVGGVFLLTVFPAFAKFKPRDRTPASEYSRASGSRGCANNGGIPLTQLAPQTFISKTASTRPMLAWYMSSSETVQFRLFEFDSANTLQQIGQDQKIPTTVGINKLKLPLNYPELTVGKTYLWQIEIECENEPIINSAAEFTVINPQSFAKNQFTGISKSVNYYAEKELWYEALEKALSATDNGKLGQLGATLIKDLAESEILIGEKPEIAKIQERIKYLQQISSTP